MGLQPMAVWLRSASLAPFTVMVGEGRPSTSFSAVNGASAHGCLVAISKPRSLYRHGRRRPTIHEFLCREWGFSPWLSGCDQQASLLLPSWSAKADHPRVSLPRMGHQPMAVWLRSGSLAPFTVMVGEGRPSTSLLTTSTAGRRAL